MILKEAIIILLLGLNQKIKKISSTIEFKKPKQNLTKVSNLKPTQHTRVIPMIFVWNAKEFNKIKSQTKLFDLSCCDTNVHLKLQLNRCKWCTQPLNVAR